MKRIKITNFRKAKEPCEIELGPITFFTGQNNSGKSTVLKSLMVLSDYGKSDNHLELTFRGENKWNHKIDCYQNAANWDNFKQGLNEIEFSFDNRDYQTILKFRPLIQTLKKTEKIQSGLLEYISIKRLSDGSWFKMEHLEEDRFQIHVEERFIESQSTDTSREIESLERNKSRIERRIEQLEKRLMGTEETRIQIRLKEDIAKQKQTIKDINSSIKKLHGEAQVKDVLVFSPIFEMKDLRDGLPVIDRIIRMSLMKYFRENEKQIGYSNDRNVNFSLMRVSDRITRAINFSIDHLSPHRNSQTRLYINDEHSNDIYALISKHAQHPIKKTSKAGKFLKTWMEKFDIGIDYNIKPVEGIASMIHIYESEEDKKNETPINLVDKGFGAGQIFTILLCIALKINERENGNKPMTRERFILGREALILIEEPEANLHPALQAELAELFFDAYDNYGIRFIIETHSEYLIRHSQLIAVKEGFAGKQVAERGINHTYDFRNSIKGSEIESGNPFRVFYFQRHDKPYEMKYQTNGKFDKKFGEGFFDKADKIAMELFMLNKK